MNKTIGFLSFAIMMIQELYYKFKCLICSKKYKNKFVATFTACIICIFCFVSFSFLIHCGAKAEDRELLHKYYTVVTIESGDSLWDYASEYGELGYKNRTEYIKEIQSINHLQNIHKLVSGETIVLPYYSYDIL